MSDAVVVRPIDGIEEARAAAAFQERVWGEGFSERVPASLLHVLPRVGSVAIGAWTTDGSPRMVGFVFGVTGVEGDAVVHWSDILGVAPEFRDHGIGRRLKLAQREAAVAAGAVRMYWTFDPLEARNAWVNVRRLGAGARDYVVDMYGVPNSPLHRGIGTDRLIARWDLRTAPPPDDSAATPDGTPVPRMFEPHPVEGDLWDVDPDGVHLPAVPVVGIPIPSDIQTLKSRAPELATRWRAASRAAFQSAFASGREVIGVERGDFGLVWRIGPGPLHLPSSTDEVPA